MDEDYDACDLENWFLAIQSADGQVMIPSFHRPAIIRIDPQQQHGRLVEAEPVEPNGAPALGRFGGADPSSRAG